MLGTILLWLLVGYIGFVLLMADSSKSDGSLLQILFPTRLGAFNAEGYMIPVQYTALGAITLIAGILYQIFDARSLLRHELSK